MPLSSKCQCSTLKMQTAMASTQWITDETADTCFSLRGSVCSEPDGEQEHRLIVTDLIGLVQDHDCWRLSGFFERPNIL